MVKANPVIATRGINITLVLFGGETVSTKGILHLASSSPANVESVWANAGPIMWVNYDGADVNKIAEVIFPFAGDFLRRRAIYRQRIHGSVLWNTVWIVMQELNHEP